MSEQAPSIIELGARAIAKSYGHDPDEMAPTLVMCTADNHPVPYWQVYEEQAEACLAAARASSEPQNARKPMTDDQIKHTVDRFLCWKLPSDFNPDSGISYERLSYHDKTPPSGTNLFDATQADAMVRYMVEALPLPRLSDDPTKSAPASYAPHNSGERLPSSDAADAGADTDTRSSDESAGVEGLSKLWMDRARLSENHNCGDVYIECANELLARLALLQTESRS